MQYTPRDHISRLDSEKYVLIGAGLDKQQWNDIRSFIEIEASASVSAQKSQWLGSFFSYRRLFKQFLWWKLQCYQNRKSKNSEAAYSE